MTARRLLIGAAILHVALAIAIFVAGRARLAPSVVDRDGIVLRVGHDSYDYQAMTARLTRTLRRDGVVAWMRSSAPVHVRALSLASLVLAPLFGDGTLAAEPFNLICYLAVVALVFAIGREAAGPREGVIAGTIVAVWPTFLAHTLQLLKDPLFVAGALALILLVMTWLTRDYDWRDAAIASALLLAVSGVILVVRGPAAVVVIFLMIVALALLIARQIAERRVLLPNLAVAVTTLAIVTVVVAAAASGRTLEKTKNLAPADFGDAKSVVVRRVPSTIVRTFPARGVWAAADVASMRAGGIRSRFAYVDRQAGSGVDDDVVIRNARDLLAYLPRAAAVGLWAPFPAAWLARGQTVGASGRLLAGIETLTIFVCELLAIAAVLLAPRRIPALLLLIVATLAMTAEAVVVSNLGALYRFRYSLWFLLIVLGVIGLKKLRRPSIVIALLLLGASCARPAVRHDDIALSNTTGFTIRALYISPHAARHWQENVLGHDAFTDGDAVVLHLPRQTKAMAWDLRADGDHGYRAEWSSLDLSQVSSITLRVERAAVVADLETHR